MSLKIIKCEESSVACFLGKVKEEEFGSLTSLEDCKINNKSSIVLGKIIKFINTKSEDKCVKILVREILPDSTYGVKFKAVIQETLAQLVNKAALRTGDRLGFFEPHVFNNPAFESPEDIKYILQIGNIKHSVMWYAKKQYILAQQTTSKDSYNTIQEKDTNSNESDDTSNRSNSDTRRKPQIHLPVNPQIPSNTQKLNPRYVYKTLAEVKSDAFLGDLRRVNIFAVVSEITKGLSDTTTGKYTIICKLVDDSAGIPGELINFDLHFFTSESTIIGQIEQGDILRLHRVKMELFMNDVDGRIFNSQDVVIFKKDSPGITPISCIKNLSLTDEDKRKILNLKKWYKEEYGNCLNSLLRNVTLLSDIRRGGDYCLLCKVVSQPIIESSKIILSVTDGSVMKHGAPRISSHIPSQYDLGRIFQGHLVTDIEVFERLNDYSKLKINDYVYLRSVTAIKKYEIHLSISSFPFPIILDLKMNKVLQMESRLKEWEVRIQPANSNKKHKNDDEGEKQGVQDIHPNTRKDESEQVSNEPQVTEKCAFNHDLNITKNVALKKKSPPLKIPSYVCNKKSCAKPGADKVLNIVNQAQECDQTKTSDNKGGHKTRKQLFTANYMDLSDATDDTSEVLVQGVEEEVKTVSQVVVSPKNLSLENLIELVKSKYCSPRMLASDQQPSSSHSPKVSTQETSVKRSSRHQSNQATKSEYPVVKLVKLTKEEISGTEEKAQENNKRKNSIVNKDVDVTEDDPEDASTVINLTLNDEINRSQRNKKLRLDMDSHTSKLTNKNADDLSTTREIVTNKVTNWLFQQGTRCAEDLDMPTVRQLLVNQDSGDQEVEDLSSLISSNIRRVQVFLLQVVPDPVRESLNFVSGYCIQGCQRLFLYSTLFWKEVDNQFIPFCPSCQKTLMDKKVILMFMLQLNVMDRNGNQDSVVVCREHGETFFGCSVKEFVTDVEIRRSRVQLLMDNTIIQHSRSGPVCFPLLDLSIAAISNIFCVVKTRLKLPPNP